MFNTEISILLNTEIPKFNSIEYWKCSIPKFQYYWIPKYWSSIVLNIENVQYRNFNTIEYRKKFQYWSSIIPKFFFNISPHPLIVRCCLQSWLTGKNNFQWKTSLTLIFFIKSYILWRRQNLAKFPTTISPLYC